MLLALLLLGSWLILGAYSFWFFFKAKTLQPLSLDDLALTWKLHKQQTGCKASRIHCLITKSDEIVGFKCECGYEFLQKRLMTQKARKQRVARESQDLHSLRSLSYEENTSMPG